MVDYDIRSLKRLLDRLKGSKNNQSINDLDNIATAFGCIIKTTKSNENRIYYAPYKEINPNRITVAIPHPRRTVLSVYVGKVTKMLEEIISKRELEQGGDNNDD